MERVYDDFMNIFLVRLPRRVIIRNNKILSAINICLKFLAWIIIILWVIFNNGHLIVYDQFDSTVGFSVKETVFTNYSIEDFNTSYVKSEDFENYNRIWDTSDYVFRYPTEVQVMTNMAITANQTQSICPAYSIFPEVQCHNDSQCKEGLVIPDGVQTGRCVKSDFPNKYDTVCEIKGWCPSTRYLPPLNNYSAVLGQTVNNTLWLKTTVYFDKFKITIDNQFGKDMTQFVNCRYNPETEPYCPVFILGDIVKHIPNTVQTYEQMARFGAVIAIAIKWDCHLGFYSEFDPYYCKPEYSFRQIDNQYISHANGQTSYRDAYFYNSGKTRTTIRSYRIRFVASVTARLSKFDFYKFLTNTLAYKGFYDLCLLIFINYVRRSYKKIDEDISGYIEFTNSDVN